ncbi:cytochrome P450 26C1 [Pelobates cultripes]|uniref:Cytochrome P450 26C1 n=1 Tax=Pelobates cultripes TaxID=61616 RepID=A0AAD1WUE0_PELCU|nr:cytochrome P450 26C1 [Pelobates cultripes]
MFLIELNFMSFFETALTSVLSVLFLLAVSHQLWSLRWHSTRDRGCNLPLPKGSMGWPFFGETLHWLVQGSDFHSSRRERYGNIFKTHLLGKPVIRVTGAENIRKILLGEHSLVSTQWPQSTQIILGSNTLVNSIGDLHRQKRKIMAKVFSHSALESYLHRIQEAVSGEIHAWCRESDCIAVYPSSKAMTFRIAARILLGLSLGDQQFKELAKVFEQLVENLFSLPLDIPFSGLRKGIKARDTLHQYMEEAIKQKISGRDADVCEEDALDYLINSAKENGKTLSMQELKETAIELLFAAFFTTASASSSLILLLLKHPSAIQKIRQELISQGLHKQCQCGLSLDKLKGLHYLDNVVKEVLRLLPPVSGGYRTALQTFELDGCQIPKGWSVMYSIRDTHETAEVYKNAELFDPDRFGPERNEGKIGRFNYIPFGGGVRSCIGKELAQTILKILAIELVGTAKWELATPNFPKMQTVPIVHPVDGLQVFFRFLGSTENDRMSKKA